MIISKALESERQTLFLLCYITSMIFYINHSSWHGKLPKQGRNDSFSEASSYSSSTPSFDDWLYSVPLQFQPDPYASQQSNFSFSYMWQYSNLRTSAKSWCTSPNSPTLRPTCLSYGSLQSLPTSQSLPDQRHPIKLDYLRRPSQFPQASSAILPNSPPSSCLSFSDPKPVLASYPLLASDPIHLTHQAISTLKSRLSTRHKSTPATEFLFPVWCLFRAAILQGDEFAAEAHERFLRHLVYKAEGVKDLPPWLIRVIVEVDLKLGDAYNSEDGEERNGGELLVESELRERMFSKSECKEGGKDQDCW